MTKHSAWEMRKATLRALVVPAQERRELQRRYGVNPAGWSCLLGIFQTAFGLLLYVNWYARIGLRDWPAWAIDLMSLAALFLAVSGVARIGSYLANGESLGDPVVWMFVRIVQAASGIDDSMLVVEKFGPQRPDRAIVEAGADLVVLATREKRDWEIGMTVRIEDEFFSVAGTEVRPEGEYDVVAYLLEVLPESEPIRGPLHTEARLPEAFRAS